MLRFIIEVKRRIADEQFQKLKNKFLTKEQSSKVHLKEKPNYFWLRERPWSEGATEIHWIEEWVKADYVNVFICLFRGGKTERDFLRIVAHEFAHAYLAFNDPANAYEGSPEHDEHTDYFFDFLIKNYPHRI